MPPDPASAARPSRTPAARVSTASAEAWLHALYIAAEGTGLRDEDRRKAREVAALLSEVERALARAGRRAPVRLLDAAAGKGYAGLLAAKLLLEPSGRPASVVVLEREPARVAAARAACDRLGSTVPIECRLGAVESPAAWSGAPTLVVALHACGPAADAVIDGAVAAAVPALLLVPCCTSRLVEAAARAAAGAEARGVPRHAGVRRRYVQAMVDADRTLRLEAAGYETEVVEFVGATVTPHNLLWRARRVGEPRRMAAAAAQRRRLWAEPERHDPDGRHTRR
jgi:hypothetical protein